MRLGLNQRTHFHSQAKDRDHRSAWKEALVVATLLIGATVATWMRAGPAAEAINGGAQVQRADIIDDILEIIDMIIGGGSGTGGSGSGGGTGSGGGGNP